MLGGKKISTLKVNPVELFDELEVVMREARAKGGTSQYFQALVRGSQGGEVLDIARMNEYLSATKTGRADMLNALATTGVAGERVGEGLAKKLSTDAINTINKAKKELGGVAKTFGRPLLYGLAGTAALMMILGGPKAQEVESPLPSVPGDIRGLTGTAAAISQAKLRGITPQERDLRPESIPVPGQEGGPAPPGMATPSTYMTQQMPMGMRITARGRAGAGGSVDIASVKAALNQAAPGMHTNVRVTDSRRKLTSQHMADMLEGAG
jgi:hypothetical protein